MNFLLCVVAFLLLACVVVPLSAVAILAATGRKRSAEGGDRPARGPSPLAR